MSQLQDPWQTRVDTNREFLQHNLCVDDQLLNSLMGKRLQSGASLLTQTEVESNTGLATNVANSTKVDALVKVLRFKGPKEVSFNLLCHSLYEIQRDWIVQKLIPGNRDRSHSDESDWKQRDDKLWQSPPHHRMLHSQSTAAFMDPHKAYHPTGTVSREWKSEGVYGYGSKRRSADKGQFRRSDFHQEKNDGSGTSHLDSTAHSSTFEPGPPEFVDAGDFSVSVLRQQVFERDQKIKLLQKELDEKLGEAQNKFSTTVHTLVADLKVKMEEIKELKNKIEGLEQRIKEYEETNYRWSSCYRQVKVELDEKNQRITWLEQSRRSESAPVPVQETPTSSTH